MLNHLRAFIAAALLSVSPMAAIAATVTDVMPAPVPSASNTNGSSEFNIQSYAITGGTEYCYFLRQNGQSGQPMGAGCNFVSSSANGLTRFFALTNGKSDLGVPMTAAAGTPSGTVGVSRTAGTSLVLVGEATSGAQAKTDKVIFETNLADSYVAGAAIPITVNCNYSGTVVTGSSTTMTVTAYSEVNGVETALTVTAPASILIPSTAANLTYSLAGTGLSPGSHIVVELTMLVTSASGAVTGQINSVSLTD